MFGKWSGRRTVLAVLAVTGLCACLEAGPLGKLNPFRRWANRNRVDSLIITGNYGRSRLLAELAQYKTKQPIILISPTAGGSHELYFMPSKPEAMAFEQNEYREFVDFLQPRRIIILGDDSYVPPTFVAAVRDRYPTVILESADWMKNAVALGDLLYYGSLAKRYGQYLMKLEAATGGAAVPSDTVAAPAPMSEPLAVPQAVGPDTPALE